MCVFCGIIKGQLSAFTVYKDEMFTAILDKYPISPGHTLLIPNEHYQDYLHAPDDVLGRIGPVLRKLAVAVKDAMKADGVRIGTNVGASAGQVVFHLHVHIIPAWDEHPKGFKPRKELDPAEGEEIAKRISKAIEILFKE